MTKNLRYVQVKDGSSYHIHIAEKFYRRDIGTDEVVHHFDGNPQHFEKCNLNIMKKEDHKILSEYMQKEKEIHYPKFKHWNKKKDSKTEDEEVADLTELSYEFRDRNRKTKQK